MSTNKKIYREFTDLRQIQTIEAHQGVVWALKFSGDGHYLASAGHDHVVRVWRVHSSRINEAGLGVNGHESGYDLSTSRGWSGDTSHATDTCTSGDASRGSGGASTSRPPLFESEPYRELKAHSNVVLDLDWSSDYLLSSSMDYTVVLWNLAHNGPIKTFKHVARNVFVFANILIEYL